MIRIVTALLLVFLCQPTFGQGGWVWGKGSIGNNATSWPVAGDPSGNVFAAGVSKGTISFDNYNPSFSATDNLCVLVKYDGNGDFLWARSTQDGTNASLINITTDNWGNCYVLGWLPDSSVGIGPFTLYNTAFPAAQYFVAKYGPEGDVIWAKNAGGRSGIDIVPAVAFTAGYAAKMFGLGAITTDRDGNIYVTTGFNLRSVTVGSYTLMNSDPSGTTDDIMLVKYDGSGNVVWANRSGGSGADIPCGITVTPAGTIYTAGLFNSDSVAFGPSVIKDTSTGSQKWNAFIARYDAGGNPVWACGSSGVGRVYAAGVASDASNNVYLTGGMEESSITFSGTSIADTFPGRPALYLVKFDAGNNVSWYKTIGSPTGGIAWGYGVASVMGGNIWVSGAFSDEVNIDGHILDTPATNVNPVFIAGFDTSGRYVGSAALQSGSDKQAGIACDAGGSVFLCSGYTNGCSPFIIAADVLADVAVHEEWQYVAKYSFSSGPGGGPGPDTIYARKDTTVCFIDNFSITAPPGYPLYRWDDGSTDTLLHITEAGIYRVMGIGKFNSVIVDTFYITTNSALCECHPFLPDAFTPNGDGRNDTYGPVFGSGCAITKYAFSIYNRWGQCVFYTQDPYERWDGRFNGANADMDVYMFYLIYTPDPKYPEHVKKGDLTLVR